MSENKESPWNKPKIDGKINPADYPFYMTEQSGLESLEKEHASLLRLVKALPGLQNFPLARPARDLQALTDKIIEVGYEDDFVISSWFGSEWICQLAFHGYLCTAMAQPHLSPTHKYTYQWLAPKLHLIRAVIDWTKFKIPSNIHKKAAPFRITIDRDFDAVIKGIVRQHSDAWFYPRLCEAMNNIHKNNSKRHYVHYHSIEVWMHCDDIQHKYGDINLRNTIKQRIVKHIEDKKKSDPDVLHEMPQCDDPTITPSLSTILGDEYYLVAGEIGVTVGKSYVSLSGFRNQYVDHCGTVQLYALGAYLQANNIDMWDLGMNMDYKRELGSINIKREEFVKLNRTIRDVALPLLNVMLDNMEDDDCKHDLDIYNKSIELINTQNNTKMGRWRAECKKIQNNDTKNDINTNSNDQPTTDIENTNDESQLPPKPQLIDVPSPRVFKGVSARTLLSLPSVCNKNLVHDVCSAIENTKQE